MCPLVPASVLSANFCVAFLSNLLHGECDHISHEPIQID